MTGRKKFSSVFMRYALSTITLLAVMVMGIFGYLYIYVDKEAREKTVTNHVNRLSRIAYQHEDYLSTMLNTAVQMGLSPFIEPFHYEEEPNKAYDLLRQMAPYTVTNSFCDQIFLVFEGNDHVYTSSSSMTMEMFLNLVRYEHLTSEELQALLRAPGMFTVLPAQRMESSLMDDGKASVVTFFVPLGTSVNSSKGTMMFVIKERTYWSLFADAIEDSNNTYILYRGEVLACAEDFPLPVDRVMEAVAQSNVDTQPVAFSCDGEEWQVLAVTGRGWDMQYAVVLRSRDVASSVWNSMVGLLILLVGLSACGVLGALLLARRNTRPIREVARLLPEQHSGDELVNIQTGIRELSARNTDLTFRLEQSLPLQRHDFVLRFMKGRYLTREEACRAAAAVGMNIDRAHYAVVLSGVQDYHEQPFDLRQAPFDQLRGTTACGVELMAMKAHMYLIFADVPEDIRRMAELLRTVSLERNGHAIVALSRVQTDFAGAPSAYLEAAFAYDNRFVMEENGLLDYAAISTSIDDIMPQARKITAGINQALLLRNRRMLSDKVAELLHFLKHTSMSPYAFRLIYNDVIDALLQQHTDVLSQKELYDIFSLSNCQTIDDLDALLRNLCDAILTLEDAPPVPTPPAEDDSMAQVVRYMQDHDTDPELSISAIAEAFGMPTARLSLAFKNLMHTSPLEYLTLLRVERSKELLAGTELSIKEIAVQVGYYDASSFIRRFKQMTGVTPLQYRRSKEEDGHATTDDEH